MVAFSRLRCTHKDPNDDRKYQGMPRNFDRLSIRDKIRVMTRQCDLSSSDSPMAVEASVLTDYYWMLQFEFLDSGANRCNVDEVMTFVTDKTVVLQKVLDDNVDMLSGVQQLHLGNFVNFTRRFIDTPQLFMNSLAKFGLD